MGQAQSAAPLNSRLQSVGTPLLFDMALSRLTPLTRLPAEWDLLLSRISILVDVTCYVALAFSKNSTYFCVFVVAGALGSGANPALSSLALMFADPKETGKLMAAMGVFQTLMAQIVAPFLFSGIFA